MRSLSVLAYGAALLPPTLAQFPPAPEGVKVIKSKFNKHITISYKEVCTECQLQQTSSDATSRASVRPLQESSLMPDTSTSQREHLRELVKSKTLTSIPSSGSSRQRRTRRMLLSRSG